MPDQTTTTNAARDAGLEEMFGSTPTLTTDEQKTQDAMESFIFGKPVSNSGATSKLFGPVIHAYTRAQALADGMLIDVSETAREAGITFPVAITAAAWADCVEWSEADSRAKRAGQSERGRLWDVVSMLRFAIRSGRGGELIRYQLSRVPRPGCGRTRLVTLKAVCGPGDDAAPVITIMGIDES